MQHTVTLQVTAKWDEPENGTMLRHEEIQKSIEGLVRTELMTLSQHARWTIDVEAIEHETNEEPQLCEES